MRGIDLDKASDNLKRLNPDIFGNRAQDAISCDSRGIKRSGRIDIPPVPIDRAESHGIASSPKMNKTERRFYDDVLAPMVANGCLVVPQPTRFFRLKGGGTYTPDFILVWGAGIIVYEVKYRGAHYHGWEQGYERYRRAALEFASPCIEFDLCVWNPKELKWDVEVWECGE